MPVLDNGQLRVRLSPKGGALISAETAGGRPLLRGLQGPFDVLKSACFPLVPLGNRVGSNMIALDGQVLRFRPNTADPLYLHGDGWLADWAVDEITATLARMSFAQRAPANSPHVYQATQLVQLAGNRLCLTLEVTNTGDRPMPFGLGFHPYFPRPGAEVEFQCRGWWTEGPGHLPVARQAVPAAADFTKARPIPDLWLNNAYDGWDGHATIRWPGMRLDLAADPLFSTLMVYASDSDPSFFCLEPMTHLPNAIGIGQPMHVLAPGDSLSGGITFTLSEDPSP